MQGPESIQPTSSSPPPADFSPKQTSEQASISKTSFSSMAELKREAPEVVRAMMEGIASRVISQMKKHAQRIKKILRESERRG